MNTVGLYIQPKNVFEFHYKKIPKTFLICFIGVFIWWFFTSFFVLGGFRASLDYLLHHGLQILAITAIVSICINFRKNKLLKAKYTKYIEDHLIANQIDLKLSSTLLALNKHNNRYILSDFQKIQAELIKQKNIFSNNELKNSLLKDEKVILGGNTSYLSSKDELSNLNRNIKIIGYVLKNKW